MWRAQGSPLLNCTWREIPFNSSWQRQWAGTQIKQSQSRRPINPSHSLACLRNSASSSSAQPLRSSCKSTQLRRTTCYSNKVAVLILSTIFCPPLVLLWPDQDAVVDRIMLWNLRKVWFSSRTALMFHRAADEWSRFRRRPGGGLRSTKTMALITYDFSIITISAFAWKNMIAQLKISCSPVPCYQTKEPATKQVVGKNMENMDASGSTRRRSVWSVSFRRFF